MWLCNQGDSTPSPWPSHLCCTQCLRPSSAGTGCSCSCSSQIMEKNCYAVPPAGLALRWHKHTKAMAAYAHASPPSKQKNCLHEDGSAKGTQSAHTPRYQLLTHATRRKMGRHLPLRHCRLVYKRQDATSP